jgi:hypothetical protein
MTRRPPASIDRALRDPNLLGAGLGGDVSSWSVWCAVLKAAFAIKLTHAERAAFAAVAGGRQPPTQPVSELWAVVGRRGGKSRVAAALGVHAACFLPRPLAAGETGEVVIVAASRSQANVIFKYVIGFLEASPVLRQEIESVTATEVRLRGNVVIAVRAGSYRTVRGLTLLAAIIDEVAFLRDELSAVPDIELYRALLPALATTGGMLIGISTPYRRTGLLYQKHRDHFGQDSANVLVVAGPSALFNPTLDQSIIARAVAADPEGARAEWDAEFRADIAAFLDDATIDAAIDYARPLELPPRPGIDYRAFSDASGGRHDAYTLAIGHLEDERCVCDVVRGIRPPFDPQQVTAEFAALAKDYRVDRVVGDNYSAGWVEGAWRDNNVEYQRSEIAKSQLYVESLPLFMRGAVSIPDHARLIRELRLLERRAGRSGKDVVDHGRNGSDDFANSLCGLLYALVAKTGDYDESLAWVSDSFSDEDHRAARLRAYVSSGGAIVIP